MDKDEFTTRFADELESAARAVEERLGGHVARVYEIAFGEPRRRPLIDVETAIQMLSRDAPRFPRIVDLSVIGLRDAATIVFVRPSDHTPTLWEETWNVPPGRGPFKTLVASEVDDRRGRVNRAQGGANKARNTEQG